MLLTAFFIMLLFVFAVVAVVMRPTVEQKAVHGRLTNIGSSSGDSGIAIGAMDQLLKGSDEGSFSWVGDLLQGFSVGPKVQVLILQSDSKATTGSIAAWSVAVAIIAALIAYLTTHFWLVAVGACLGAACLPVSVLSFKRKRRVAAFNVALPEVIDMMARSLRAGHSTIASIGIIGEHAAEPAKSEFSEVFRKQNFGLPLRDALMQMLERIPSQDLRVVVTGILVQKDTGGNLAEILDRTVHVIRERLRIQGEIRTHTAQGRMTGWILCMLPVVMLGLINLVNPGYSKPLFHDPTGQKLMYIGVVLLGIGGFTIRQIVNGIEV